MKLLDLKQGTGEWLSHRAACLNASDAPAMMGASKYQTRAVLLRQKATGILPEYDQGTLARFRAGHDAEAAMRPVAEQILDEDLFPVVGENEIEGLRLSASSDGLTMDGTVGFEHKLWNEELAASVRDGIVPDSHLWQIVHQHAVFGLEETLFMVSDGTQDKMTWCWVEVSQEQIAALLAGWQQFMADVADYQPEPIAQEPTGRAPETLPALHVEVTGMVTSSNLAAFKETALAVFRGINTDLQTDADFADAEKTVKWCKDVEDRLEQTKQHALSQTASIDELFRTMDGIKDEARAVRLKLDKLVKGEKENRKYEIVIAARGELEDHVDALVKRIGGNWMPAASGVPFAEAIKGLKSLDSMRDKVGAALANAKIEASAMADRIEANRKCIDDAWMFLFPDFGQICTKEPGDFARLYGQRIQQENERAAAKLEAERARIRAEEQAKAEREAAAKAQAERDARDAETARSRTIEQQRIAQERAAEVANIYANQQKEAAREAPVPVDEGKTMKLGDICARLGFTLTAQFLASLGFEPVAHDKNAKLYRESDFPRICAALVQHITNLEK